MNHKVLLADDSLTIQKVIRITLANQPYDITDCSTEDELFNKLSTVKPKLVFLDFNLSEKYTGYELTTKIKSLSPATKVLLLLGTFDSVDDAALEKCGASDKIVKPFDSNKFISICKQLIDTFPSEEIPYPEKKETLKAVEVDPDDQWTVSHSTAQIVEAPKDKPLDKSIPNLNPLAKEMSEWGMSVPGVINAKDSDNSSLPGIIGDKKSSQETKFPETDDLDYPTIEEMKSEKKKPTLVPTENFNIPVELEGSYVEEVTNVSHIEDQIRDEVEENLWQVDEFEDLKKQVSSKIEEMKNSFEAPETNFDDHLFNPTKDDSISWEKETETSNFQSSFSGSRFNQDEILNTLRSEMDGMIKKHVQDYMDQMFEKKVEKIAWDVIPDLAENLIRQELVKISEKILKETR